MTSDVMSAEVCDKEYKRLGYDSGYVFGMTPTANMDTAGVVLVGLNPGGDWGEDVWEIATGNAYLDAYNGARGPEYNPLRPEVSSLLDLLAVEGTQVFAGQFIPFRSQSFDDLPHRERLSPLGVAFGHGF